MRAKTPLEESMFGLARLRLIEIGAALLLTLAALIFIGLTVWAEESADTELANEGVARGSAGTP